MAHRIERYATYMWQEVKRLPVYRFQTNDHRIARKLKKRPKSKLVLFGINSPVWVFQLRYSSPSRALIGLSNLTGADVQSLPKYDVFVSYTLPYMDIQTNDDLSDPSTLPPILDDEGEV